MILILSGFLISFITVILFLILCVKIIISFIKKKPFPKKIIIATLFGVVLVSSIYIYETYFFTFSEIDREYTQRGPGPVTSPTEKYTVNAYYELYGGAAGGVNVWVKINTIVIIIKLGLFIMPMQKMIFRWNGWMRIHCIF